MKIVARDLKVHLKNIMNYFIHCITNANKEGINSMIALIEIMAFRERKGNI